MWRALSRALSIVAALVVALNPAGGQDRSIRLRNFDADLVVHADGSLDVIERITVGFAGTWNGIVRDLSLHHNTGQGRPAKLDLDIIGVTDRSGAPLRVEQTTEDGGWTRRLRIWIPGASDADRQIIVRYRVANAIRFFFAGSEAGELDELYWNVTGNAWTMPIDQAHARVTLPDGVTPKQTAVYTGSLGAREADAKVEVAGNTVSFTLSRPLSPYEGMTIAVGWPPGHISSRPSRMREGMAAAMKWSPLLLPFIVFALAFRAWQKRGRDPEEGSYVVRYEPVKGASPAELGTLIDNDADMRDITATLVDLAVRGYIRIEEVKEEKLFGLTSSTDYVFHLLRPRAQWSDLAPHEQAYLDAMVKMLFMGETGEVKLSGMRNRFYTSLPGIRDAIYDSLVAAGYYLRRPDKVKSGWSGAGIAIAVIGFLVILLSVKLAWVSVSTAAIAVAAGASALVVFLFGQIMPARTVEGARAREATLGFREFLSRVESERFRKMITSPEMFERFLPYAMAFGVEDKWARAFEDIYKQPPNWYVGGTGHFSASDFSSRMSSMSSAAASSMSSSPSSSGSRGGGSSGGGSGGGGGSGF